jgi:hypothetical protein
MKNKLIIFFLLITGSVPAQTYNKRILLSSNLVLSGTSGSHEMTYNNASFIKLFPNIKSLTGGRIGLTYLFGEHIGAGVSYTYLFMNGVKKISGEAYSLTKGRLEFFSSSLFIQTGDLINGKFRFFSQAGPMLSLVDVTLQDPVIFVDNPSGKHLALIKSTFNINPGLNLSSGIYYSASPLTNYSLTLTYNYFTTGSVIYPDTSVNLFSFEAGVTFKIFRWKRYYY